VATALVSALLAAVLAAGAPAGAEAPPALLAALREVPAGGARAEAATRPLLGAPYLSSPLGEGFGRDPDPRFRLDAFDCMTFVETALALASAGTVEEAERALDDIRYSGAPAYERRNHEVLSQWIPANLAKGWIEEVTAAAAGPLARREEKVYTPASWEAVRRAGRAIPGLPRERLPVGAYAVEVVPLADVAAALPALPRTAVVFVVRADAPDRATRITHAALLVTAPDGSRRVRHATSSRGSPRLIEEGVTGFVRRESSAWPSWSIVGLAFFGVPDRSARVAALGAGPGPAEDRGDEVPSR